MNARTRVNFVAWVTLLLLGSLPLAAAAQQAPAPPVSEQARAEAPVELALRGMDGAEQRLSEYRGRIVVLNFWATWCVPCREEMPMLVRLQQEYESRGVLVIGPSADAPDTQAKIAPFLTELQIQFPIWVGATTEHMEQLGLGTALPATAVIDREGRIVGRILGPLDERDLRARIEWLLADPTTRGAAPAPVLNTFEKHQHGPGEAAHDEHGHKEEHAHAPGMDGASTVPS
ncbi:MAG: TlpA family protein disulfide reductase [Candidatus Acidiferrales bacterium]